MSLTTSPDPLLRWSFLVNLVELILIGTSLIGGFGSAGSEDIATDDAEVLDELTELGVGDKKSDKDTEMRSSCGAVSGDPVANKMCSPCLASSLTLSLPTGRTPRCLARVGSPAYDEKTAFCINSSSFFSATIMRRVSIMSLKASV